MPGPKKKLDIYKRMFQECDTDRNDLICMNDFKKFLENRISPSDLSKTQISHIFKLLETEGTKTMDFKTFVNVLEHRGWKHNLERYMNIYIQFIVPQPKRETASSYISGDNVDGIPLTSLGSQRRGSIESDFISGLKQPIQEVAEDIASGYSCCPPPFAMIFITLLECVFFLIDIITEKDSTGLGLTGKIFVYEPNKRQQVWRFFTYMFVHTGYFHVSVNLVLQIMIGIPLEKKHNWWKVSLLYFAGVIAGSLAFSIADPCLSLAGASGGVFALLTAHISVFIMNCRKTGLKSLIQLPVITIIVGWDLGYSLYSRYHLNENNKVGDMAHYGGAAAGFLVGIYLFQTKKRKTWKRYLWWTAIVIYILLMMIAITLNIFFYPSVQKNAFFSTGACKGVRLHLFHI